MDQWIELRRKIRNQHVSLRQLERETGIHRKTLRKIRDNSQPLGYQRANPIEKTKIGPYLKRIKAIIESDKQMPKKQRHTAKKILEILQSDGFVDQPNANSVMRAISSVVVTAQSEIVHQTA